MCQHNITTDGSTYSDDEDDTPQTSASTPKQKRKRTTGQNPDVRVKQAKKAATRKATGKRGASTGTRRSKRHKAAGSDEDATMNAQTD